MTYCLAAAVDAGLVFASDSRTNAGLDQVNTYRKMHVFEWPGERVLVLLSAGNLATTQAVVRALQREAAEGETPSFATVSRMEAAAEHLGAVSVACQRQAVPEGVEQSGLSLEATFILGGQIAGQAPQLFLIYPQGNFITVSDAQPFLQIGEIKYGKPILDRMIRPSLSLESAARCALVSIDSTMRSNVSVGPPVDVLLYRRDSLRVVHRRCFEADDPYFVAIRTAWSDGLARLFDELPPFDWE